MIKNCCQNIASKTSSLGNEESLSCQKVYSGKAFGSLKGSSKVENAVHYPVRVRVK